MIKKEFIDKCANYCRTKKGAEVLHAESVRKLNDKNNGKKNRVIVVTNQFITYFKEQKEIKPDRFHYWRNVSSFDVNEQTVIIKFEKDSQLRFIHPNVEEIKSVLIQFFLRTFSSEELGPLDLSHFPHPPIGVNGRGILSRFDTLLKMENKDTNIPLRAYFEKFLLKRSKYVNFDESLEIDDVLSSILEALRPLPYLQFISLPKIVDTNNLYEALTEFVSKNSEVRMLALRNNLDDNSNGFLNAFSNSPVSQLKGLTFENIELTDDEINKIHDLSVARQFSSASFIDCIHQPVLDTFSTNYLSNELMAKLRYLSLDKTVGINLSILSKRIQALSVLSLAHCELEISDVLETFGEAQLENLRFLNLSGNKMERETNAQFPPNLERLHVSKVTWGEGTFPQFLKYILSKSFSYKLKLNCSSAQGVSENDWDDVSNIFDELDNYPLGELSWSYNKVSESLIQYLTKNPKLATLFLSNCFDAEQDHDLYQTFCQELPKMESLNNLVVNGSDGFELREYSTELFNALKEVKTLNILIVNGNKFKDEGIQGIKDLITENASVNTVSFDGSYISSIDALRELIDAGSARKKPLHISWPVNDLTRLVEANIINSDELDSLKKDITVLSTGRKNVSSDAQWLQNFNIAEQQKQIAASQRNVRNKRGSVRIGYKANHQNQAKESKKDQGRKVRAGSFRGLKRPSLLTSEKSPTEEDTNLWINEPFDMFFTDFTDEFPLFFTDDVNKYFQKNPIGSEESTDGKKHRHHSSKHHSSHHHHSKHHSSKKHHHHSKTENSEKENENETETETESQNQNEEEVIKTRDIKLQDDSDEESQTKEEERERKDQEFRERLEREEKEEREKEAKRVRKQKDREMRERLEREEKEEREKEAKRIEKQKEKQILIEEEESENENESEPEPERKEKPTKQVQEDEEKESEKENENSDESDNEDEQINQKNIQTRNVPLSSKKPTQSGLPPKPVPRPKQQQPEPESESESEPEPEPELESAPEPEPESEHESEPEIPKEDEDDDDDEQEKEVPKERPAILKELDALFDNIVELEPIEAPKNSFLYIDPYGRPLCEPLSFVDGSNLIDFKPEPIDLINMAPPKLSIEVSASSKPQLKRAWPPEDSINRSSLEKENGELRQINVGKLKIEELSDFDEDEEDEDDEEELEKVEPIVVRRRERKESAPQNERKFPVFPLLNVPGNENNDSKAMPINWNFQFTQISNLGNYKFFKESTKPLEQLVSELDTDINNEPSE